MVATGGTKHELLEQEPFSADEEEGAGPLPPPPSLAASRRRVLLGAWGSALLLCAGAALARHMQGHGTGTASGTHALVQLQAVTSSPAPTGHHDGADADHRRSRGSHGHSVVADADATAAVDEEEDCRMAITDDACYKNVVWAMTEGVKKHPEWYEGLTAKSLFEDFQQHLSSDKNTTCPRPCKVRNCETAAAGSDCWKNAQWAMTTGVKDHPEWYKGLSNKSAIEDFQTHLHQSNKTICPKRACNPQPFKAISFFCWAVVRPEGYELGLVKAQLAKKAGIFACDDYAVVSDKALDIDGVKVLRISSTTVGGYTDAGTSPNAPIFVDAWSQIKADGRYKAHDWVIKCDPDTVLIPDRLKLKLVPGKQPANPYPPPFKPAAGAGQWVTNCDKMANWGAGWGNGWPMMYGSVEIISRDAIDNYFANEDLCKNSFAWQGMGEDAFMGLCLRKLKAGELFMKQGDGVCGGGACTDASYQAYHPRKDITSWMQCWGQAAR